jgi:hypothetical protein
LILYIGNYVNQGTNRGGALGFSLEYMTSIKPLKGREPDVNMLTFIVETINNEFPDLLGIIEDLAPIRPAQEMKFCEIDSSIDLLNKSCRKFDDLLLKYLKHPVPPGQSADEATDNFIVTTKIHL